ncbi:MAG: hypothetical protein KDI61_02660 [Alphaproteobacteria bacterium]|nr:hypothetical protein [Alphaproteobacteria bacterium]MCB1839151.1 hypothetical protein [Alphaproteobacteria bacterium]
MSLEVETVVAISIMMAVFSAVAAVGTSIVLGAGFERLRSGFDVVRKQTGFFSDAIHKLEKKMELVDAETGRVTHSINEIEAKVANVGDQANAFSSAVQTLERKVEIVDKQAGYFGDAIHKLEQKIDTLDAHEDLIKTKMAHHADADLISTAKTEALVSHAEDLLTQMSILAGQLAEKKSTQDSVSSSQRLSLPQNLTHFVFDTPQDGEIRYH